MAIKRDIIHNQNSGFFQDLILRVKLILRLMGDKRINLLLKLLPIRGSDLRHLAGRPAPGSGFSGHRSPGRCRGDLAGHHIVRGALPG